MLLTPELAQPIVDRAMAILQRNVNMMDGNGFIVGSGDPSRIGNFHQGAEAVLRTGRRVEIHPEDLPHWGGVRMASTCRSGWTGGLSAWWALPARRMRCALSAS